MAYDPNNETMADAIRWKAGYLPHGYWEAPPAPPAVAPRIVTQSRWSSFIEAWVNVAIGFGINFAANLLVLPLFGFDIHVGQALGIGLVFTVISVARGYAIRRWFNGWLRKQLEVNNG